MNGFISGYYFIIHCLSYYNISYIPSGFLQVMTSITVKRIMPEHKSIIVDDLNRILNTNKIYKNNHRDTKEYIKFIYVPGRTSVRIKLKSMFCYKCILL